MKLHKFRVRAGFTLVEMIMSLWAFTTVMGCIMMSFNSLYRAFCLAQDYGAARLTASDFMNLDFRRCMAFEPTLVSNSTRGGWKCTDWKLPVVLEIPQYYTNSNGTKNVPSRRTLTTAEWEAKKAEAIARGKAAPPNWEISYGDPLLKKLVVYQLIGDKVVRQEGIGTYSRSLTGAITWTWSGRAPTHVTMAKNVQSIVGIYRADEDLTPEDLEEPPPDDFIVGFRANYTIAYAPSRFNKTSPQPGSILKNNITFRYQFYGY